MIEDLVKFESFLNKSLRYCRGVGEKTAQKLEKKGFRTVRDVIFNIPYQWIDKRNIGKISLLKDGDNAYLKVRTINSGTWVPKGFLNKKTRGYTALVTDGTGYLTLRWFTDPPDFIKDLLKKNQEINIFGKVKVFRGSKEISHPEIEKIGFSEEDLKVKILPVYHGLPQGFSEKIYRKILYDVLFEGRLLLKSLLPKEIKRVFNVIDTGEALFNIHFPQEDFERDKWEQRKSIYHQSLLNEELFLFFSLLAEKRKEIEKVFVSPLSFSGELLNRFTERLNFPLTKAQIRVIEEIKKDLKKDKPMHRLLQGDVGSGKTIVAISSALMAVEAGKQVAFMVPTEILAEQHYLNLKRYFTGLDIRCHLITSSLKKKDKDDILKKLEDGETQILVGTHSLIQENVNFKDLGLAIIDEQHRFGVEQRNLLIKKGRNPHTLYMSATPIPRTLTMTVYGDLDLSIIDELPSGRKPVRTMVLPESHRERAFKIAEEEIKKGFQVYVVYPVIEEDNQLELKSAKEMYEVVKIRFKEFNCGLLHGRISQEEKEQIMDSFKKGDISVLVSTTVIEVGVDVPKATVMIIEHGERFGLSQLHQLRGRIGRGGDQSTCIVLVDTKRLSKEGRERLIFFRDNSDGFKLAEFDLKLRGPGEIMGTKQSGIPEFRFVDILKDSYLIEKMKINTENYFKSPPSDYLKYLKKIQQIYFQRDLDYINVG
ncbi:MAG: ATP-dependent DNA helicase RecG [Proteobacteria bacterium]|nr:ATP-dependent DNA helicase RecG [Pseudomonadota bacterium]